jgi:hypothetical protein
MIVRASPFFPCMVTDLENPGEASHPGIVVSSLESRDLGLECLGVEIRPFCTIMIVM